MACGLFSSTKSEALGQAGSIDYSGIDWFASVIDPDNVDSRIAALCPDGADCYLLSSRMKYKHTKYDVEFSMQILESLHTTGRMHRETT